MKLLTAVFIAFLLGACSSTSISVKTKPDHIGVDAQVKKLYDEFMWLSVQNNIQFYNKVTIGFTKIKQEDAIGMCTWGGRFREIDLDLSYWKDSTSISKVALFFHEMTHCFCSRIHDYGEDKKYPEDTKERVAEALSWLKNGGPRPGHWEDGCPTSLMYPVILDDDCTKSHYSEYVKEMFDRCKPW